MIRDGRPFQTLFNSMDTKLTGAVEIGVGTGASTTELLFALLLYLIWFFVFFCWCHGSCSIGKLHDPIKYREASHGTKKICTRNTTNSSKFRRSKKK